MHERIDQYISIPAKEQNMAWYKRFFTAILPEFPKSPVELDTMEDTHRQAGDLLGFIKVVSIFIFTIKVTHVDF